MSKIFGYTKKSGKHWFNSDAYSDNEIESIIDPEGGAEITLATAIPSPFARIDLVKTAFSNVTKSPELKSYKNDSLVITSRDDEKLVSECLDIAELLFNYDSVSQHTRIIEWNKNEQLEKLKSGSQNQKRLAETLRLYLEQDKVAYNFDSLKSFYLIEYKHTIIGCTSPATMFFTSANNTGHAEIRLTGNDILFDGNYCPLYKRDPEFQIFFYSFFKSNPILSRRLKVVSEYLKKNLAILEVVNRDLYDTINNLPESHYEANYSELDSGSTGNVLEILGVTLRKRKKEDLIRAVQQSDFRIRSKKYQSDTKPLVLQNDLNKPLRYVSDNWSKSIKVPYLDQERDLSKRKLPKVSVQYPYLTVSDFLEPYLIQMVYPINSSKYFNGNLTIEHGSDKRGYLLPIKKEFFNYFDSTDLLNPKPENPKIEMIQGISGSVKVKLWIPIEKSGEFIVFERMYYAGKEIVDIKADESNNIGAIIEHQIGVTIYPFLKTKDDSIPAHYRIQLIDRDIASMINSDFYLNFFDNTSILPIKVKDVQTRSVKKRSLMEDATTKYFVLEKEFDYINLTNKSVNGASGIIIPKWPQYNKGSDVFSFSIDFGTTNTHIEYKVGDGPTKPFDITTTDMQIATLFDPSKLTKDFDGTNAISIKQKIEHEFVPNQIGNSEDYKFPQRTVIAESRSLNIATQTYSLADFNIPFIYEKQLVIDRLSSNLKWSKLNDKNGKRVRAFLENLMMLIRNKVLMNNGNLQQTRIVWFFPTSMSPFRISSLQKTWESLYSQYINSTSSQEQTIGIPESLAPYYYFKGANRLQGGSYKPVVSIDIGGGTTDVVIYKSNPQMLTSFKFAANSLFGDGYSEYGASNSNGLLNRYYEHYWKLFDVNNFIELKKILEDLKQMNRSEDINTFLFSIENNPSIKDRTLFSYHSLLANDDAFKIIFLYFYTAIVYHVADLMKKQDIMLPKHLVFSGTGSKVLGIISTDNKTLAKLSKQIFEDIYGVKFDQDDLTVETEKDIPKEITCKGGLMCNAEDLLINIDSIKKINTCLNHEIEFTYGNLNDSVKDEISEYVKTFNEYFIALNDTISYQDYFGVSKQSFDEFKIEINKHIRDYLEEGLQFNQKMDEVSIDSNGKIGETLFFYPLTGSISSILTKLSQLKTDKI